jgi:hypothetical protein
MKRKVTLEDLRDDSSVVNRSFNKLRDEVKSAAKNKEHEQLLLTDRVLKELIDFQMRKAHEGCQSMEDEEKEKENKRPTKPLVSWVRKKTRVQRRKSPRMIELAGASTGDMPTELKKKVVVELQGSDVKMVIEKVLTKTDLDASCNRLLIPSKKIIVEFLTQEEQENIVQKKQDNKHFQGMKVSLIEPSLKESSIWLKKWNVGNGMPYVLSSPWISVATKNKLKVDDVIQLWSFRVNGSLCFALIKLNN